MRKISVGYVVKVVLMYLIQIPFFVYIFVPDDSSVLNSNICGNIFKASLIIGAIYVFTLICLIIPEILSTLRNDFSPLKPALISKLVLIPWFVLNVFVCFLFVAGFLNPFLIMGIPLLIGIECTITYLYMISTSVKPITYSIKYCLKNPTKINLSIIIGIIFMFILCLDSIGTYLVFKNIDGNLDK